MRDVLTIVLAGAPGTHRLLALSRVRTHASVPFGGGYRLIDFTLSNCVHSGITNIAVCTQHLPISLKAHIGVGRPWDLDRRDGGVRLLEPYSAGGATHWYQGTADALAQNLEFIDNNRFNHILVTAAAFVYNMDYRPLLDFHRVAGSDVTLVLKAMGPDKSRPYGTAHLGRGNMVVGLDEPGVVTENPYASLGIYIFDRRYLVGRLKEAASRGGTDIVTDVVIPSIAHAAVYAYLFYDYWMDVSSIAEYTDATLELLGPSPPLALSDPAWPVFTKLYDDPPVKFGPGASVDNAIIADGCIINGRVENSVLFRRAYVEAGATVKDAIVMDGSRVDAGAAVYGAILDKDVRVQEGAQIGVDVGEPAVNRDYPHELDRGITILGKGVKVPPAFAVGRNCLIDIGAGEEEFERVGGRAVVNGSSILLDR